jgi:hypothetical protein
MKRFANQSVVKKVMAPSLLYSARREFQLLHFARPKPNHYPCGSELARDSNLSDDIM